MGERRKRKSMWDMEEIKQFSGMNEHNSSHDSGDYHEFPAPRTFTKPKSRDHSGQPSLESNEENSVDQVNGNFIRSGQNSREGKDIGGGNRYYQNMSPGFDGVERHKYKYSTENDRRDSHRHPRRDRSRSRSRSRSNGSTRGQTRIRSPIRDYRSQSDKSIRICREFSGGRCRKGSQCRFVHSYNSSHGHISKDSYSKSDLRDDVSDSCHGDDTQFTISNATDGWQNMIGPNPSTGFSGGLNGPEAQLGVPLDLHSQIQNHQEAVQITGMLETKVKQISPLSTVDTKPDYSKVDNSESSKLKQETIIAYSEADEGNRAIGEEIKGVQNNEHSDNRDGHKKVEESIGNKDEKVVRLFKNSLIEFVKDILKPTWKEGRLSRDVHKTIVKKVVDKVISTVQADHIPKTQDKIDQYLSFSKPKIAKLVQAYVERSLNTDS